MMPTCASPWPLTTDTLFSRLKCGVCPLIRSTSSEFKRENLAELGPHNRPAHASISLRPFLIRSSRRYAASAFSHSPRRQTAWARSKPDGGGDRVRQRLVDRCRALTNGITLTRGASVSRPDPDRRPTGRPGARRLIPRLEAARLVGAPVSSSPRRHRDSRSKPPRPSASRCGRRARGAV
jgi:hypothetical protein